MQFAQVMRGCQGLYRFFDGLPGWSAWWRLILALHGKPPTDTVDAVERVSIVAQGCRFYGRLYLGLGLVLVSGLLALMPTGVLGGVYWPGVAALAGLYLVAVSKLAFHGAELYAEGKPRGTGLLVCFFVAVMLFLSAFAAVVSGVVHEQLAVADLPNLALFGGFWLVGIGSYGLELVYLLGERSSGGG